MRPLSSTLIAAATAGVVLASSGPPAADAAPKSFRVTAEGTGTFQRTDRLMQDGLGFEEHREATFAYKVTIPQVWFDSNGDIIAPPAVDGSGPSAGTLSGSASMQHVTHGWSGSGPVQNPGDCLAPQQDRPIKRFELMRDENEPAAADGDHLVLVPLDSIDFSANCDGALANRNTIDVWKATGAQPFAMHQRFFLPKLATDQGKIIQHVEQSEAQKAPGVCPGRVAYTETCTFRWTGKITFERTALFDEPVADVDLLPLDPGPAAPAAKPLTVTAGSLSASKASVRVTCATACAGTVAAHRKRGGKPLATRRFSARPGVPVTVTLRLHGSAKRAVRRSGTLRMVVRAGDAKATVTLRRATAPRRR